MTKNEDLEIGDLDLGAEESDKTTKGKAHKKNNEPKGNAKKADKAKHGDGKKLGELKPYKTDVKPGSHKATNTKHGEPVPGFYVNRNGIAFPAGFKFKGGHIDSKGQVVLVKCPECGNRLPVSEAIKGLCDNQSCNYYAVDALDEITEEDLD